jgi:hypothetical protein
MVFVNEVAAAAEAAGQHPDIDIRWNTVTLALSSHAEGGLTERDFQLAARIQELDQPTQATARWDRSARPARVAGLVFLDVASAPMLGSQRDAEGR